MGRLCAWVVTEGWNEGGKTQALPFPLPQVSSLPPTTAPPPQWSQALPFLHLLSSRNVKGKTSSWLYGPLLLKLYYAQGSLKIFFELQIPNQCDGWGLSFCISPGWVPIHRPHVEKPTSGWLHRGNRSQSYETPGGLQLETRKTKQKLSPKAHLTVSRVHCGKRENACAYLCIWMFFF